MKTCHVSGKTVRIIAAAAGMICLLVYLRALSCGFVNWDDGDYVLTNPVIRTLDLDFIRRIFTSIPADFYIPLTSISFAVDYHFWGLDPFGYHLTNILLHSVNTALVVCIADRLLRSGGGLDRLRPDGREYAAFLLLAGLLWGIHPLRVESVAWVTERKDVLNGVFFFGAILAYLRYVRMKASAEAGGTALRAYAVSVLLFIMSLMSKPSSIMFPFMLLVIDWYPLKRCGKGHIRPVLLEKLPFLLISLATVPLTVLWYAKAGTFHSVTYFPLSMRVYVSGNALFEYFRLYLFPAGILPYYHLPYNLPKVVIVRTVAVLGLLAISLCCRKKCPWLAASLLFFTAGVFPVLPFLGNGASIALAARYTYLPSLLATILIAVSIVAGYRRLQGISDSLSRIVPAAAAVLLVCYAATTQLLIDDWKNSGAMWSKALSRQYFDKGYFYRALYYVDTTKNYTAAVDDYTECIAIAAKEKNPEIYNYYAFRGEALANAGLLTEALRDFDAAISLFPHRLFYYHRGTVLQMMGRIKEAEEDLNRAGQEKGRMFWIPFGSAPA